MIDLIRVNYENARYQASILQGIAGEYDEASRSLKRTLAEIPGCWEGSAAVAFTQATQKRITQLAKLSDEARSIARHVRRVADEFEAAERRLEAEMAAQAKAASHGALAADTGG